GDLPGEAHNQVQSPAEESEKEEQDQHRDEIAVGDERCGEEHRQQGDQQRATARVERRRGHARRPMMPCGRSASTKMSRAKDTMLFIDGARKSPASASDTPINTPP